MLLWQLLNKRRTLASLWRRLTIIPTTTTTRTTHATNTPTPSNTTDTTTTTTAMSPPCHAFSSVASPLPSYHSFPPLHQPQSRRQLQKQPQQGPHHLPLHPRHPRRGGLMTLFSYASLSSSTTAAVDNHHHHSHRYNHHHNNHIGHNHHDNGRVDALRQQKEFHDGDDEDARCEPFEFEHATFDESLSALSSPQSHILFLRSRPLLILGPAGTGKTVSLAARAAHIVATHTSKADEILILTSGKECAERVKSMVELWTPLDAMRSVQVKTVHAKAMEVVRGEGEGARLLPANEAVSLLLDYTSARSLRESYLRKRPMVMGNNSNSNSSNNNGMDGEGEEDGVEVAMGKALLNHFRMLKVAGVGPDEYLEKCHLDNEDNDFNIDDDDHDVDDDERRRSHNNASSSTPSPTSTPTSTTTARRSSSPSTAWTSRTVAKVYKEWVELKRSRRVAEFDEMVARAADIVAAGGGAHRYRHVMVDELQDHSDEALLLAYKLARDSRNVVAAGDSLQQLPFGGGSSPWTGGGNAELRRRFLALFPAGAVHELTQNMRSAPGIVRGAARLMSPDRYLYPEQLPTDIATTSQPPAQQQPQPKKRTRKKKQQEETQHTPRDVELSVINESVHLVVVDTPEEEASRVAEMISALHDDDGHDGYQLKDIAVVTKSAWDARHIVAALSQRDIPVDYFLCENNKKSAGGQVGHVGSGSTQHNSDDTHNNNDTHNNDGVSVALGSHAHIHTQHDDDFHRDAVCVSNLHRVRGKQFKAVFLICAHDAKLPGRRTSPPFPTPKGVFDTHVGSTPHAHNKMLRNKHVANMRRLVYIAMTRASEVFVFSCVLGVGTKDKPSRFIVDVLGKEAVEESVRACGKDDT